MKKEMKVIIGAVLLIVLAICASTALHSQSQIENTIGDSGPEGCLRQKCCEMPGAKQGEDIVEYISCDIMLNHDGELDKKCWIH